MALWYVDNALATGANNGTSWVNAWRTIGTIVWGGAGVVAGDTLYLSGGSVSKTYTLAGATTILAVGASGSAGLPITISGGIDAGHSGTAIIGMQNAAQEGIDLISRSYITIQNLTITNTSVGSAVDCIWCSVCSNIIIQNCTIHCGGSNSGVTMRGIEAKDSTGPITIRNNYWDTATNVTDQVDCIYAQNTADGLLIDGNNIHQLNYDPTGHNDGIQLGFCNNSTISNNYVEVPIGGTNVHGMLLSDPNTTGAKTYTVFNNVVNCLNGASAGIIAQNTTQTGKFLIYNNTIYVDGSVAWGLNLLSPNAASEVKNNIVYVSGASGVGVRNDGNTFSPTATTQIAYNDVFATGGAAAFGGTTTNWNAVGGISGDPLFVTNDVDFHLRATSPAINVGLTIGTVTTDKDGRTRPIGSAYDIGAYEFQGDTPRTTTAILTTLFQDGQPDFSISEADMRDLTVSVPQWDVVGGVPVPYCLGGVLDAASYMTSPAQGGVIGAGQSTGQRQTNATALQAAITFANTNNKIFRLVEGIYEIYTSTGLIIPAGSGFVWEGSREGTIIRQFYPTAPGAPVLVLGDNTSVALFRGFNIDGFNLDYGVTQTFSAAVTVTSATPAVVTWTGSNFAAGQAFTFSGTTAPLGTTLGTTYYVIATGLTANTFRFSATVGGAAINTTSTGTSVTGNAIYTSANALVVNFADNGIIQNFEIGGTFAPYRAIHFGGPAAGQVFSCTISQMTAFIIQRDYLYFNGIGSTGNLFEDIYLGMGVVNSYNQMTGSFINFAGDVSDMAFIRLNLEWAACNRLIENSAVLCPGLTFEALHLEGIKLTGFDPCVFSGGGFLVNSMVMTATLIQSANLSGTPRLIYSWNGAPCQAEIRNLKINSSVSGEINTTFTLFDQGGVGDYTPSVQISGDTRDAAGGNIIGRLQFDAHMPIASFRFPISWARYLYGAGGSRVETASILMQNASASTYIHYGQYEDATLEVPLTITAFQITLSNRMGATGTQLPRRDNTVHVRRASGTASGTVTIVNGGAGGTGAQANVTNSTGGVDLYWQFNGTDWVAYTPVT